MLNLTIRGIQRSQAPAHLRPKRLTLTNTMLDRMLGLLDTGSLGTLDMLVLKAALTVSEFTITSRRAFDPRTHSTRKDIAWIKDSLCFFIKRSKTDQAGKGTTISVSHTGGTTIMSHLGHASIPQPLQAMQAYLSHCRPCKHTSATADHASIPQPLQAMQACCTASLPVWMITLIQNPAIYPARPAALIRIQFIPVQHPQLADWCSNCSSTCRQDFLHLPFKD